MALSPAAEHKEKGNSSFKAGNYPEAIGHYTAAILADTTDPTFPLNRAAAYLKLNKNEDAERDCSAVLAQQKGNVKALFRRAQARVGLGKLADARLDLLAAAKAEPGNAAVRGEFAKVEELIAEATKKTKSSKGTPIAVPSRPPTQTTGTPYRRRVPIAIKDNEPQADDKNKGKAPEGTAKAPLKSILKGGAPPSETSASSPAPGLVKPNELLTAVSTRAVSSPQAAPPAQNPKPEPPGSITLARPEAPVTPASPAIELQAPAIRLESAAPLVLSSPKHTLPSGPLPEYPDEKPPTLVVFLQKWTNANSNDGRAHVLFSVPPDSIPVLFGPTLESPLLGTILGALFWAISSVPESSTVPRRVLDYMRALSRVPRFTTLVMFMDEVEKRYVRDIWDKISGIVQDGLEDETKRWRF